MELVKKKVVQTNPVQIVVQDNKGHNRVHKGQEIKVLSTVSSTGRQGVCGGLPPTNLKQQPGKTKGNMPNSDQSPKTRTPPSQECGNRPQKRLNMEDNTMQIDSNTNQESITRDNISDGNNTDVTRRHTLDTQNSSTRSKNERDISTMGINRAMSEPVTRAIKPLITLFPEITMRL